MKEIWTIGHSNRTLDEHIDLLQQNKIGILVDIRGGSAGSRTFPYFNKEALEISIPSSHIRYVHIPELGGRRGKQKDVDEKLNNEWRLPAFKNYADYTQSDEFEKGLEQLIRLSKGNRIAYMCAEAVPWRCHRSIVSDYLDLRHHLTIHHIVGKNQICKNKVHEHAVLKDGKVIYPSKQLGLF